MTKAEYNKLEAKAMAGTLSDDNNPIFILSTCNRAMLVDIANGKINLQDLAKIMLEKR
jgi:hypothetical protein